MKRILKMLLLSLIILPGIVLAQENDGYFVTLDGINLSEKQYNNLIKVFDEDTIATMDKKLLNSLKDNENLSKTENTKYVKTEYFYDKNGKITSTLEEEVTKEEALSSTTKTMINTRSTNSYSTSYKKITISITSPSASSKIVTVTNTWLQLPSVKSYDVIGIRPTSGSMTLNNVPSSISGYQKHDGTYIRYAKSSSNTKIVSSLFTSGKGGVGISMNIVDTVSTSLQNSITVDFISSAEPFKAYGSYQHAQSSVTLSQSQNYTFSSAGKGNVFSFASAVSSKYDGMGGVLGSCSGIGC